MSGPVEKDATICPACGLSVSFKWQNGFISEPHNTLVADWVYHTECWDAQVEKHPPGGNPMTTQPPAPPTDDEIVEAMLVAANDVLNDDDTAHAEAMEAALATACPIIREAALREAAAVARNYRGYGQHLGVEAALLALIPQKANPHD